MFSEIHFLLLFLTSFLKNSSLFALTSFPSLFTLFCVSIQDFFGVKREILLETWENTNKEIWKNSSSCFCPSLTKKKRMFFKTNKSENTFSLTSRKSKNECWRNNFWDFLQTDKKFRKTIFGDVEKDFFWWEKSFFFRKNKIEKCNKEKRRNQKGEEQLMGVHRKRWKEEMIKETGTRRFCNNNRERKVFSLKKSVWQQKNGE